MTEPSSQAKTVSQSTIKAAYHGWCRDFLTMCRAARRPMTDMESDLFVRGTLDENLKFNPEAEKELKNHLPWPVLDLRAKGLRLELAPSVSIFLGIPAKNPATSVMWAHALKYHTVHDLKTSRRLTLLQIAELCPLGIPNEDQYRALWEKQKIWQMFPRTSARDIPRHKPMQDNFLDYINTSPDDELNDYLS